MGVNRVDSMIRKLLNYSKKKKKKKEIRNQFLLFDYAEISHIEYNKKCTKWIPVLEDAEKEGIPYGLPSLPFDENKQKPKIPRPYLLKSELDEYILKKRK